ncbi:protein regulator of cytokinesis 1 isoform A [Alligator mississippiensis]|uniref:Protein regulator of cytokinesis 1 isoform A n=1 Tax=Alligator mississippiensis TaxID=8496 RepID=A0A151NNX7_ALLMI|nr:protein regulator of cytokinesis 1 isoform A [Alligator mississippiensis]
MPAGSSVLTAASPLQLEARQALNEAVCAELRSRILELWDRLQVPAEERDAVAPHMTGSRARTRRELQLEVDRLEELKLQNMKVVIEAIRVELAAYWDKCFYSPAQREGFAPYYDASDPSRFANRGGNLLKEEKQRAKLQKTLPKLEEELRVRIEGWEHENQEAFLVSGQQFMEYVAEQWQLFRLEKEKEKQERQLKKSRQIEEEMLYGAVPKTPAKRRVLGPHTPGKLNATSVSSATPNSTIRSGFGTVLCHSPVSRLPPSAGKLGQSARHPGHVAAKPPRPGLKERNKENVLQLHGPGLSGGCTPTAPAQRNYSINSVASTYSEFARELSKASRSDTSSHILNSTTTNLHC